MDDIGRAIAYVGLISQEHPQYFDAQMMVGYLLMESDERYSAGKQFIKIMESREDEQECDKARLEAAKCLLVSIESINPNQSRIVVPLWEADGVEKERIRLLTDEEADQVELAYLEGLLPSIPEDEEAVA